MIDNTNPIIITCAYDPELEMFVATVEEFIGCTAVGGSKAEAIVACSRQLKALLKKENCCKPV